MHATDVRARSRRPRALAAGHRRACASTGAVPRPFPMPALRRTGHARRRRPGTDPAPSRHQSDAAAGTPPARSPFDGYALVRHGAGAARRAVPQRRHRSAAASTAAASRSTCSRSTASRCRARSASSFEWGQPVEAERARAGRSRSSSRPPRPGASHVGIAIGGDSSSTRRARPASCASSASARATGRRASSAPDGSN